MLVHRSPRSQNLNCCERSYLAEIGIYETLPAHLFRKAPIYLTFRQLKRLEAERKVRNV